MQHVSFVITMNVQYLKVTNLIARTLYLITQTLFTKINRVYAYNDIHH